MGGINSRISEYDPFQKQASCFVQSLVERNCVVIFSKTTCPYSEQAKKIFDEIGVEYCTVELNQRSDGEVLQNALHELTGARTVPRVFINGSCIGGGTETKELHEQGKLVNLINQCTRQNIKTLFQS